MYKSYGFIPGLACTHRHPEFTSGSHEIEADTGLKRRTKLIEFSTTVDEDTGSSPGSSFVARDP